MNAEDHSETLDVEKTVGKRFKLLQLMSASKGTGAMAGREPCF